MEEVVSLLLTPRVDRSALDLYRLEIGERDPMKAARKLQKPLIG
jgi:hypothetical protein